MSARKDNRHIKREVLAEKARQYCAYRERCTHEVEEKLRALGADRATAGALITRLQTEGFIDNKRFATIFARGKFQNNRWGKVKIRAALLAHRIPDHIIKEALEAMDHDAYMESLQTLVEKKTNELKAKNKENIRGKTAAYCIQKGYEPALVYEMVSNEAR